MFKNVKALTLSLLLERLEISILLYKTVFSGSPETVDVVLGISRKSGLVQIVRYHTFSLTVHYHPEEV